VGWLLTPLAAWAFSFMGALAGARLGRGVESPQWGLTLLLLGAGFGAVLGAGLWVWALRRAWHSALRVKRERLTRERAVKREKEKQQKT
jgi:hypothetical protein